MIIILSFPRSGNHLTRFIIEYITGRPTMGCLGNASDVPIHQNTFEETPDILSHVTGEPVGYKSHDLRMLFELIEEKNCSQLLLIERDPVEAIFAHHTAEPRSFLDWQYLRNTQKSAYRHQQLRWFYETVDMPKAALTYEKLISPDPDDYLGELDTIAQLFAPHVDPDRFSELCENFDTFRAISSQGKGRAWKGFRSQGREKFHQKKVSLITTALVKNQVRKAVRLKTQKAKSAS